MLRNNNNKMHIQPDFSKTNEYFKNNIFTLKYKFYCDTNYITII